MNPISICMIAKNEEKYIEECLKRLAFLDCEIIFVDTGSTDRTLEIAAHYTKHIYHFDWIDDFSAARNFSIEKASFDWVWIVDCDEYLENEAAAASFLSSFLKDNESHKNCIGLVNLQSRYNQNGETIHSVDRLSRIFHKEFARFCAPVHEQIIPYAEEVVSYVVTPFLFSHMSYFGESVLKEKAQRNLSLLFSALKSEGESPYLYYQIGQSYNSLKQYKEACHYFNLGLSFDVDPSLEYVQKMVEAYGYTLINQGLIKEALSLSNIYDTFCKRADFVFLMGLIYMKNALFDQAISEFKKATTFSESTVLGVNDFMAYYNIGVIYECTNHLNEAMINYKKCSNYAPALARITALTNAL